MGDARDDMRDLDLNISPSAPLSPDFDPDLGPRSAELGSLDERIRQLEAVAVRARHRRRWRQGRLPPEARNIPIEMIVNSGGTGELQTGEGSVDAEDRTSTDSNRPRKEYATDLIAKALGESNGAHKGSGSSDGDGGGGSFFECNICLEMARNPVLTSCGHLFCWPCLYQWLYIHSETRECPVCKGQVTDMDITPIYGRGNDTNESEKEDESGLKIPPRPNARRDESFRQWIHRGGQFEGSFFSQMIRRISSRFNGERIPPQDLDAADVTHDRAYSLANRFFRTRGIRRDGSGLYSLLERSFERPEQEIVDLTQGSSGSSEAGGSGQLQLPRYIRSRSQMAASVSHLSSAERLVQEYFLGRPMRRNHTHSPPVEDRDSVSSIAAVIQSESQILDNTAEIESMMSLASSSSRRRSDSSRASYVDDGISRPTRRRRSN
ncbi:hypothetical protein NE237_009648 [Protea cynaroides]|uniref:E3 ubiquitin-protein ligase RMA n=1 Tax=Protea cynaroides TaxID=273540 RepID=A0A9Q0R0H7_9MAGN|nr:hypothetical protein NE237_009648 [Protea cynaroides]